MLPSSISIKGQGKHGLVMAIGPGRWEQILSELTERLEQHRDFFRRANVTIDVNGRLLEKAQLEALRGLLQHYDIALKKVIGEEESTLSVAHLMGIQAISSQKNREREATVEPQRAYLHRGHLRSGQFIRKEGSVVVLGDVHRGAEIVAGDDIIVWGRLDGIVRAGSQNNPRAVVCALVLHPVQLRIGRFVAPLWGQWPWPNVKEANPALARIDNRKVVVESWTPGYQIEQWTKG